MKMTLPPIAPPKKAPSAYKLAGVPSPRHGAAKPHIRMRKLKTVAQTAFPQAQAAFPQDGGADPGAAPDAAMAAPPMGAGPGTMGG